MGLTLVSRKTLPRPLSELASREDLLTWLSRVFLYTIIPSTSGLSPFRARLPRNLAAFVGLLIHLQEVGFPSHWLSEYLQSILSDNFVTNIAPYQDKWPIPVADMTRRVSKRKLRMDPWRVELETILATAKEGIPFSLTYPSDFATTHTDIGIFTANIKSSFFGPMYLPPYDPAVFVILYKPVQGIAGPQELVTSLPAILEGRRQPTPGNMHILTSLESFDLTGGKVAWRLSKKRFQIMRQQGWYLVAYRTDSKQSCKGHNT